MKSVLKFFARLYPRSWRQRYGVEFEALLEDLRPAPRDTFDIVFGALKMRIVTWAFAKLAITMITLGTLVTLTFAFVFGPTHYVSSAVIVVSATNPLHAFYRAAQTTLSRSTLTASINRFGLYPSQRARLPLEDVIGIMRTNIVTRPFSDGRGFEIAFDYPDRFLAQKVCAELAGHMIETNLSGDGGALMQLLDPATLPQRPLYPKRPLIATEGALAGLILALLLRFAVTRSNRSAHAEFKP
ncbi:MAG TPA: hypothetical protein VNX18_01995 [Bryobacteraceae bacterium]|nr:hypothetical protein [Bryobacteraceae bacterium]